MDGIRLGVITWRHDAAVHLFVDGSTVAYCGKSHPDGVVYDSMKAERLGRPTCRACRRAWKRLTTTLIVEGSETPEPTTDSRLI
jgi:hypothetical protein